MSAESNISVIDPFDRPSPVECYKLAIIGVFFLTLGFASVIFNGLLLWIFFLYKELRNSMNAFIIALTICNLLATCTEFPFVIGSNFSCRYLI